MTDRKTPALRALDEMKETIFAQCQAAHGRVETYHKSGKYTDESPEAEALLKAKEEIITQISKEVEEYAIKKYTKYGLISVPVCHRSDGKMDRLNVDLKIKTFSGIEKVVQEKEKADRAYQDDLDKVEKWHFDALSAIASRESLPKPPEFKPRGYNS